MKNNPTNPTDANSEGELRKKVSVAITSLAMTIAQSDNALDRSDLVETIDDVMALFHQQLEAKVAEALQDIREEAYRRAKFELEAHAPGYIVNAAEIKWDVFEKRLAQLTPKETHDKA